MAESVVDVYNVSPEKQDDPQSNKYGPLLLKEVGKNNRENVAELALRLLETH